MHDPLGPAPAFLQSLVEPLTREPFNLTTLPRHIHELLLAFVLYISLSNWISPAICARLLRRTYTSLSQRTRINWDVHVVSLVQSLLICGLALWVLRNDQEVVGAGDWRGRIWGYSGAAGLVQAMAGGYFLWDVYISTMYFKIMGPGSLAHAVSALVITMMGFRPFANYYGLAFILYELSTPFLNFHWFLDKVGMTGSRPQFYNGIILITVFGLCRLVWGTYQSISIYRDLWKAVQHLNSPDLASVGKDDAIGQLARDAYNDESLPMILAGVYLASNTLLIVLNFYWFAKMVQAVTKRFDKSEKKKQ